MITNTNNMTAMTTIAYTASETLLNVQAAVDNAITSRGWTQLYISSDTLHYFYKYLTVGGTAGVASNYEYMELDYSTSGKVILRSWQSFSVNAGVNKANNLVYQLGSGAVPSTGTESQIGQPIDLINGGSIELIVGPGYIHIIGYTILGVVGNISNSGSAIVQRTRNHPADVVGTVPSSIYMNMLGKFYWQVGNVGFCKWSSSVGWDGGNNASNTAGGNGGIRCLATMEASDFANYTVSGTNLYSQAQDVLGYYPAGAIEIFTGLGNSNVSNLVVGTIMNVARKYNSSASAFGDLLTINADANGIPNKTGTARTYYTVRGGISFLIG